MHPSPDSRFSKLVGFWVPRRFTTETDILVTEFVADLNRIIGTRGFIMSDGQIAPTQINPSEIGYFFMRGDREAVLEAPEKRPWGAPQIEAFGLKNPYQMIEEPDSFTYCSIDSRVYEPYLFAGELIAAVVHGVADSRYFYCSCNMAEVVYTTCDRVVCMGCGAVHLVLENPLPIERMTLLTAEDWADHFDHDGSRRDEEVQLAVLDFLELENQRVIWSTDQWEQGKAEFIFFTRSSPEEIQDYLSRSQMDPSAFLEAGWTPVESAPPPAGQLSENSVNVNLLGNAGHAFSEGVASYLRARTNGDALVDAIPLLARAVELLLKAKLKELAPKELEGKPNVPTTLTRLAAYGLTLDSNETEVITTLRKLRNDLQHGSAAFNYRKGLGICRKTVIFVDRFVRQELEAWIGDVLPTTTWQGLLQIPEVESSATEISEARMEAWRKESGAELSICNYCKRRMLLRPSPAMGAQCLYCKHMPIIEDDADSPT